MLRYHVLYRINLSDYWQAVKICIRNGYFIHDASMWRDTIDLLRHFGKDTHNPKYVCPANLRAEHDKLEQKFNLQDERRQLKERMREAAMHEKKYRQMKGLFFGIALQTAL